MVPVLRPVVNQHESSSGQVIAVVQPHRYTRLSSLFDLRAARRELAALGAVA